MQKEIKVDNKNNTVSVSVKLNKRKLATSPITTLKTRDIVEILTEEGHKFSKTCIEECTLSNETANSPHKGIWVFPLAKKEAKKQKPPQKKAEKAKPRQQEAAKTSQPPVFANKSSDSKKSIDISATK